ncbi:MAG: aminoglycoside phosphotransferase family protein [Chloroflexi bacterium]|nr:aminoglycoside phosphotransferase family protein [Chloroflexota bacterium]
MLEKPSIPEERIIEQVSQSYGLPVAKAVFLPLGADVDSAVYRIETAGSGAFFLKLRKENFEETSILIPRYLYDCGIQQIIPPLKTVDSRLWSGLDAFTCVLYPFIEGRSGFEADLTGEQWIAFGAALRRIHSIKLPTELHSKVAGETFSPHWRERVRRYQALVEQACFDDPISAKLADFMRAHRAEISHLVDRAWELAGEMQSQPLEPVLCHSDIHAGNVLLAENGPLYIVDWDNPILASKERDLMFIGGGVGETWADPRNEELFYQGYGSTEIDLLALAYYRIERIVIDIAEFCEQILMSGSGDDDREQAFRFFTGQFAPGDVIEIALRTDQQLREGFSPPRLP